MGSRTRRLLLSLAGMVAFVIPRAARADLEIALQEAGVNGGLPTVVATGSSFSSTSFNGTYGDFRINFLGSASDNGSALSDLMTSTTRVMNSQLMSAGAHTLTIYVTQSDYTLPGGSTSGLTMTSHIGGSVTTGGMGQALTFQSYANNSNRLFDILGATTTGPQSPIVSIPNSSYDSGPDPSTTFGRTTPAYSVTTTNAITLAAGGSLNYGTTTTLEAVPEFGSGTLMSLVCGGFLGLYGLRRLTKGCFQLCR